MVVKKEVRSFLQERDNRIISPLEVMEKFENFRSLSHREVGQSRESERFLDPGGLNIILHALPEDEKVALQVAFTKILLSFLDTGKIPTIMPTQFPT